MVGDVEIEYLALERGDDPHQEARKKASTLAKLLNGELLAIYVKRDNDWNLLVAKVI